MNRAPRRPVTRVDLQRAMRATGGFDEHRQHEPSAWLRSVQASLAYGMRTGQVRIDPHLRPFEVAFHAVWVPDQILCGPCARVQLRLRPGSTEDNRCDRCHSTDGPVEAMTVFVGDEMAMFLGLCETCADREIGGMR